MKYDYSKLTEMIIAEFGSQGAFADKMQLSSHRMDDLLKSKAYFTQKEIDRAADILHITADDISTVFFTQTVQTD